MVLCSVLVASDGMTRGMDFPGTAFVLNYDMPVHMRTYVHRAGRTARAGARGRVVTLLRSEHVAAFARMMKGSGNAGSVREHRIGDGAWEAARPVVDEALAGMREALAQED